eukprot:TRINITY_DN15885_c0_g1_i2.p1 TRINITY_DN15885_c0_g1~~TRINITY_DN15885_c0_g1_i2.p1  ORF type:complete len:608 (+),score=155.96 TRINITY_DN15885_c0_g1_i2:77-1825(+)
MGPRGGRGPVQRRAASLDEVGGVSTLHADGIDWHSREALVCTAKWRRSKCTMRLVPYPPHSHRGAAALELAEAEGRWAVGTEHADGILALAAEQQALFRRAQGRLAAHVQDAAVRATRAAAGIELAEAAGRGAATAERADFVLALTAEKAGLLRDAQGRLAARVQDAAVRGARAAAAVELAEAEGRVAVEQEHTEFHVALATESKEMLRRALGRAAAAEAEAAEQRPAAQAEVQNTQLRLQRIGAEHAAALRRADALQDSLHDATAARHAAQKVGMQRRDATKGECLEDGKQQGPAARTVSLPAAIRHNGKPAFVLEQLLGRGSYGAVFRVNLAGIQKAVKLTRVPPQHSFDDTLSRGRRAAGFAHPCLVRTMGVIPVGSPDDELCRFAHSVFGEEASGCNFFWTIMDLGGPSLDAFYSRRVPGRRAVDAEEGTHWCLQLFDAVSYLHHNGWCHRDIKVENVLVAQESGSRKVVIIDLEDVAPPGKQAHERGTLFYQDMAAEHGSMPGDVWATAMVAHFVLSEGHLPAGIAAAMIDNTAELHPPRGVPAVLEELRPCWARDAAARHSASDARRFLPGSSRTA